MIWAYKGVYCVTWQLLFCYMKEKILDHGAGIIGIDWGLGAVSVSQSSILTLAQKLKWGNEIRWYHKVGSHFEQRGAVKYYT